MRNELVRGAGHESLLRQALAPVSGDYDLVLIDCAPNLDRFTINGSIAADAVVVVSESWRPNT